MFTLPQKAGLILFTYNHPNSKRWLSYLSPIILAITGGRLRRFGDHSPTHTAQTIWKDGKLMVIDSDVEGVTIKTFDDWKKNRAWIHVFDPNILNKYGEELYSQSMVKHEGKRYDFLNAALIVKYNLSGKYPKKFNDKDNTFICSEFTGYGYDLPNRNKLTPIRLFMDRLKYFDNGVDLFAGEPKDFA